MINSDTDSKFLEHLERIANALEKHSPTDPTPEDLEPASAYVWNRARRRLTPVNKVNRVDLRLLCGIDYQRDTLLSNTIAFVRGLPANNALLWGARGTAAGLLRGVLRDCCGTGRGLSEDCFLVENVTATQNNI